VTDTKYLFTGEHPDVLASGRPVAPGDHVPASSVDPKHPHDQHLLAEGALTETQKEKGQ
jgi:hypothetical protein